MWKSVWGTDSNFQIFWTIVLLGISFANHLLISNECSIVKFWFGSSSQWLCSRVSVQGVESLWDDCRFIPADWGHSSRFELLCYFWRLFTIKMVKSVKVFPFSFWKIITS